MILAQVSGQASSSNSLFVTKNKLIQAGLAVRHPISNGLALVQGRYFTFNPQKWQRYEVELDYFESIRRSNVHVVCNDSQLLGGAIDLEASLGILYAMLSHKPIILAQTPHLSPNLDLFLQEALQERIKTLPVIGLSSLSCHEIRQTLGALPTTVNYNLSAQEAALLKIRLKTHFRQLLHPNQGRRVFFAAMKRKPAET